MGQGTTINVPNSQSNGNPVAISLWGGAPNLDLTNAAKKYITQFPGDSPYGGFSAEGAQVKLPKSLFYEFTEGELGAPSGLFNYYLLGQEVPQSNADPNVSGPSTSFAYKGSENFGNNNIVTPEESRNPTAFNIVNATTIGGAYLDPQSPYIGQPYNPKDFIFCKDYGSIPNNRMITLRRFPTPVFDNLKVPLSAQYPVVGANGGIDEEHFTGFSKKDMARNQINIPICQAITYFGEGTGNNINDIIGIESGLNWTQRRQEKMANYTKNDPGFYNGFGSVFNALLNTDINQAIQGVNTVGGAVLEPKNIEKVYARNLYDSLREGNNPLSQRIFVDINTVNDMWVRSVGVTGKSNSFNVTFKYDLTSVSDINSKMLFMDLLTNLLALGTDYGKFLTPQILERPNTMGFSFPGGPKGYKEYITDPVRWIADLIQKSHSDAVTAKTKEYQKTLTGLKNEFEQFKQTGQIDSKGRLYKSLTLLLTENMLNNIFYEPLMLSGYPTGDWHIVVGNPLNPIAMIGNLICKQVRITFDSQLGPDDFPTGMTAVYELQHARTRHRGEYESMFNRGHGRMYLGQFPETSASQGLTTPSGKIPENANTGDIRNVLTDFISTGEGLNSVIPGTNLPTPP